MADYFHTMDVTKTTLIDWFPQRHRNFTVTPEGDYLVEAWATHGYRLYGILTLSSELRTFNRATELAEYYEMPNEHRSWLEFWLWYGYRGEKLVYCRTIEHGNFWAVPDRPIISKFVGENRARVDVHMRLVGTTTTHQAGFGVYDAEIGVNDWNI